jgi:hypothetical protein
LPSAPALVIHQIGRSKEPELRSALDLYEAEYIVNTVTPLDDFSVAEFASGGVSHRVYRKGAGPDVLLMHELPGMTPQFIGLARTIAEAGLAEVAPNRPVIERQWERICWGTEGSNLSGGRRLTPCHR